MICQSGRACPAGRLCRSHALHAPIRVGEGSILLRKRRGRQEDIGEGAGLIDE